MKLGGLVFAMLMAGSLAADPLADVYARIDKAAAHFSGMTGDVKTVDHKSIAGIEDNELHEGVVKLKSSKKSDTRMLIEFTGDKGYTIELNGGLVRMYYPSRAEIDIYDLKAKRSLIDQFLLLGFGATSSQMQESYDISYVGAETVSGQPTSHIKLIPKSAEARKQLRQAELWIADKTGMPLQQKFATSGTGDFKLITYSTVTVNPPLSDKDLQIKAAKGVQTKTMGS